MQLFDRLYKGASWLVFAIALTVFFFSAERTGSLWDVGEFILGAYKLQVVHPPGAPLFLLVGRLFSWVAELVSDDPADIAFAVNLMSGICTAFAAFFIARVTMLLGRLTFDRGEEGLERSEAIALAGAGLVAGLSTAFTTSVWFSAVEGEVYAMSTMFTTLTLWAFVKWYSLPPSSENDRWIILAVYAAGLSVGVHLLTLLTFPAMALLYYFKRYEKHTFPGMLAAAGLGVVFIVFMQYFVIAGIPRLWSALELLMVNGLGTPFHFGLIPLLLIIAAVVFLGLRYAHQRGNGLVQYLTVGFFLVVVAYSTIGVVVLRANANPPINMNDPSDAMRLLPYLNREQYGERALLRGPHFDARPVSTETEERYGRVEDSYEVVDERVEYVYNNEDKMFLPRMGDFTQGRPALYKQWMGLNPNAPLPAGRPNQMDNLGFFLNYQLGWMYWRYFMWNFSGRQNGEQGYEPWNKSSGHWISGIPFIDELRLYNMDDLPDSMRFTEGRNTYFMLPFLFGILGLLYHLRRRREDFIAIFALFVITGIGIIIYSNQPPREPRERDYVLAGSFFTYAIWIGMGVLALFHQLRRQTRLPGVGAALISSLFILSAPVLMAVENYDDQSRMHHSGARDYANNFLQSLAPNAILFTYGDNDTYPLWYAQEVEGIRTDVRVVNLSLIAVDWYIEQLRRKVNDSPPIRLTIPEGGYRGRLRNQVFWYDTGSGDRTMTLPDALRFIGERHPLRTSNGREVASYLPSRNLVLPVDSASVVGNGLVPPDQADEVVSAVPLNLPVTDNRGYLIKDELAILDVIGSNLWERPIYFAVTSRPEKMFGLQNYMRLEGLALRLVPVRHEGDPQQYGVVGSGEVDGEKVYDNVMNRFRWGGFDQYDLFVDNSYAPSVQSHQLMMRRAALDLLDKGQTEKAVALTDQYFEAFPHMNFPYDYRAYTMMQVYLLAGAYEKAKPHLEILAEETAQRLAFYESIDPAVVESSFSTDYALAYRSMDDIMRAAQQNDDTAFMERLNVLFERFNFDNAVEGFE